MLFAAAVSVCEPPVTKVYSLSGSFFFFLFLLFATIELVVGMPLKTMWAPLIPYCRGAAFSHPLTSHLAMPCDRPPPTALPKHTNCPNLTFQEPSLPSGTRLCQAGRASAQLESLLQPPWPCWTALAVSSVAPLLWLGPSPA